MNFFVLKIFFCWFPEPLWSQSFLWMWVQNSLGHFFVLLGNLLFFEEVRSGFWTQSSQRLGFLKVESRWWSFLGNPTLRNVGKPFNNFFVFFIKSPFLVLYVSFIVCRFFATQSTKICFPFLVVGVDLRLDLLQVFLMFCVVITEGYYLVYFIKSRLLFHE